MSRRFRNGRRTKSRPCAIARGIQEKIRCAGGRDVSGHAVRRNGLEVCAFHRGDRAPNGRSLCLISRRTISSRTTNRWGRGQELVSAMSAERATPDLNRLRRRLRGIPTGSASHDPRGVPNGSHVLHDDQQRCGARRVRQPWDACPQCGRGAQPRGLTQVRRRTAQTSGRRSMRPAPRADIQRCDARDAPFAFLRSVAPNLVRRRDHAKT